MIYRIRGSAIQPALSLLLVKQAEFPTGIRIPITLVNDDALIAPLNLSHAGGAS